MNKQEKLATQANKEATKILNSLQGIEIKSQMDLVTATDALKQVKTQYNALEIERKSATKPLNDSLKTINGWFKPATDSLKKSETFIKTVVTEYIQVNDREVDKALAKGKKSDALALELDMPEGVSVRSGFDYEITDPDSIPRSFCSPDPKKIKAAIAAKREKTNIKGVRVFASKTLAVKV